MRSAIIKKARLDEIQNRKKTTTTNINYIQKFMSTKNISKVKIASVKIKENNM